MGWPRTSKLGASPKHVEHRRKNAFVARRKADEAAAVVATEAAAVVATATGVAAADAAAIVSDDEEEGAVATPVAVGMKGVRFKLPVPKTMKTRPVKRQKKKKKHKKKETMPLKQNNKVADDPF